MSLEISEPPASEPRGTAPAAASQERSRAGATPGLGRARAAWRLLRTLLHALQGALICALVFPFLATPARMRRVARWSARMLDMLDIELRCGGAAVHRAPVLLVANHVSWLDILAINAVQPARFVAKSNLRSWPVLGFMAACGGTLFISRERKRDALRVAHDVAAALRGGATVALFPEGTTGEGPTVLPFHANLLQAAIVTATPVQPLVLRFSDAASPFSAAAAYVGTTSLVRSLWQVACADTLVVHVTVLTALDSANAERRALAQTVQTSIQNAIDAGASTFACRAA